MFRLFTALKGVSVRQSFWILSATVAINNCIQSLSKDISVPADNSFIAYIEAILFFNGLLKCSHTVIHGLSWIGSDWVEIFSFLVGWVRSWVGEIDKN